MSTKRELYSNLEASGSLAVGGFGSADTIEASIDPIVRTRILLTIDQLQPYERNPRRSLNPAFAEIKESIRTSGLLNPPQVTRRPNCKNYIINNGGNTRLRILQELFAETKDRSFFEIECEFVPWERESLVLTGHLIENDLRGDITFIDRALALSDLKEIYRIEQGANSPDVGLREFSRYVTEKGFPVSHTHLSRMFQTIEFLYPFIPEALHAGLGKHQIEHLLKLRAAVAAFWKSRNLAESEFAPSFSNALALADAPNINGKQAQEIIVRELCSLVDLTYAELLLDIEARLSGSTETINNSPVKISAIEPSDLLLASTDSSVRVEQSIAASPIFTENSTPIQHPEIVTGSGNNSTTSSAKSSDSKLGNQSNQFDPTQIPVSGVAQDPMALDNAALQSLNFLMSCCADDVEVLREALTSKAQSFATMLSTDQEWVEPTPGTGVGFLMRPPVTGFFPGAIKARSDVYWFLFGLTADTLATADDMGAAYIDPSSHFPLSQVSATNIFTTAEWDANTTASAFAMTIIVRRIRHLLGWA